MLAEARVGTIGFAYREWSGHVYPPEASPQQFLPLYAERLSGVEISTLPPELAESWAAAVPPSFQFAVKAPGRVASELASGKGAVRAMAAFMDVAVRLGDSLGPMAASRHCRFRLFPARAAGQMLRPSGCDWSSRCRQRELFWLHPPVLSSPPPWHSLL